MEIQLLDKVSQITEAVVFTVLNLAFIIALNFLYKKIPLLTSEFTEVLPFLNVTLVINIIIHGSRIIFVDPRYKAGMEIISSILSLFLTYLMFTEFPFDTSVLGDPKTLDMALRALMIVGGLGTIVGIFTNFGRVLAPVSSPEI